jgi:tetratricopeptide (TPR) repeat protein
MQMSTRRVCTTTLLIAGIYSSSILAQKRSPLKTAPTEPSELKLQLQLRENPHDRNAHQQLIRLLSKKYAFRAQMEEDGRWLRNNPDDYVAEIEMRSLADTATNDPAYAIYIDRFVLANAKREEDPAHYDNVSDRLARALLERGSTDEALAMMEKETQLSPLDFGVWENLGDGLVSAGQFGAAILSYRKAISLDGNQEGPHEGLSEAYVKQKNYHGAITELKAALSIYNEQFHGPAPTDSYHAALKQMQDITHMEPNLAQLHRKLARVYVANGEFANALAEANAASNPGDPYGDYYLRALIYDASGDGAKATATRANAHTAILSALSKEPPKSRANFGEWTYPEVAFMSTDDEVGSAHEIIMLLEPHILNGNLKSMDVMLLGVSYCTVGRIPDCKAWSRTAMSREPKLDTARNHHILGEALKKGGDTTGAAEEFEQAYQRDPQNTTYRIDYEASRTN